MKKAKKNNAVIIAGSILAVIVFVCVFCRFFRMKEIKMTGKASQI